VHCGAPQKSTKRSKQKGGAPFLNTPHPISAVSETKPAGSPCAANLRVSFSYPPNPQFSPPLSPCAGEGVPSPDPIPVYMGWVFIVKSQRFNCSFSLCNNVIGIDIAYINTVYKTGLYILLIISARMKKLYRAQWKKDGQKDGKDVSFGPFLSKKRTSKGKKDN